MGTLLQRMYGHVHIIGLAIIFIFFLSLAFIGLAIMVYEPLYHAFQMW